MKCHKLGIQKVFEFERQHVSKECNKLPVSFFIFYQNTNLSEGQRYWHDFGHSMMFHVKLMKNQMPVLIGQIHGDFKVTA